MQSKEEYLKVKKPSTTGSRRESTPYLEAARHFDEAIQLLHNKSPKKARDIFQQVIDNFPEEKEMADRARTYIRICDSNRNRKDQPLEQAEDYYARGTFRLNEGDIDAAIQDFQEAIRLDAKSDFLPYSLAAAYALKGDGPSAIKVLEKAIKMNPENRVFALNDDDFDGLVNDPVFEELLQEDAK